MGAKEGGRPGRVAGAESGRRLLSVLLQFSESRPTWSAAELAGELELTKSAVYRYIALLREVGLLDEAPESRYRLSERTVAMAAATAAARPPLGEVARPVLERLRDVTGESMFVGVRSGWHVFRVAVANSRRPVRLQFEEGRPMSLHTGSIPRVLLAMMPAAEQERYLAGLDESARAHQELRAAARAQVARERVTESFEEIDEGIWGVAAAVVDGDEVVGALGCAAPIYRTDAEQRASIRAHVIDGAQEIAALLARRPA